MTELRLLKRKIMAFWEDAVRAQIPASKVQKPLALLDSLPEFLDTLADVLEDKCELNELLSLSQAHARQRAGHAEYTIGEVLLEYHVLRKTIIEILPTTVMDRIRIHDFLDQSIAQAGEEFHKQAMGMRERFLAALSHDMRNPLSTAKMAAQHLGEDLNHDEREKCRLMILRNLERMDMMISDLLDAQLIQAGQKLVLRPSAFDLFGLAREIQDDMASVYGPRFILEGKSVQGVWDRRYLRRAIENLLTNAIKYGKPEAEIRIAIADEGDFASVLVFNKGTPISEEEIPHIFDPFRRSVGTGKQAGWGIGLTLVRGAVEAHGGKIDVRSPVGGGVEFKILLPKAASAT